MLFAATVVVAGALAYQAARAAQSQRAAAEATLRHHAAMAAWRFAREGRGWVAWGMDEALAALNRAAVTAPRAGPELVSTVLAEKDCDCMTAGLARTVFRVELKSPSSLALIGEPLSERTRDGLVAAAVALAADTGRRGSGPGGGRWLVLPPGTPRLARATDVSFLWLIERLPRGERAVFGMIVEAEQVARPLAGALDAVEFFPASLIPAHLADSLVRVDVAGANGHPLFSAGPPTGAFTGSDTLGVMLGGLTATVAIDPAAAAFLVGGGLPASRTATIAGLLALALALGGAALVLLRREVRLARLREDFVSGVSHELRTPLTQIRLLSELLQSDGFRTTEERQRATDVIHREALRLTNLVDNVLAFAGRQRRNGGPPPQVVSLAAIASEVAESFEPLLGAQGNRLDLAVADDVPVAGERDAVSRVLRNLVENALKYGPRGQTIRVAIEREGTAARIRVDDEGPGVPAAERSRIWEPYYRLERDTNTTVGGSGLGLAVVAGLARGMGGRAWVEDGASGGARFVVELPLANRSQGDA